MKSKEVIDKLVPLYLQVESINEAAKEILAEAKEAGLDHSTIAKVAKAVAAAKVEDLKEKTEALQNLLNQV